MPIRSEQEGQARRRFEPAWAIALTAAVLIGLAAWRSTLGLSFLDDAYYSAVTLRLVQGARLFADEMYVQSLGFLAAVPFGKLWTMIFGTTGFVAAVRVFYVALASAVGFGIYKVLRPSFGRWAALAAVAVPLLAPPYNLLAVSYDTMAALGMTLALTLCFKALRDSSRWAAAGAGAAAAFACVSYPPLIVAALALLTAFAFVSRGRRLWPAMAGGAAVVAVGVGAWLLSRASITDFRLTYEFVFGAYSTAGPAGRLASQLGTLWKVLHHMWRLPLWAWYLPALALSVGGTYLAVRGAERSRLRSWLFAALPFALVIPVFANWSALHRGPSLRTLGANYLIAFILFALPGVFATLRQVSADIRRLVAMAVVAGPVGFIIVSMFTSAGISRGSGIVGLAPLAMVVVLWWSGEVGRLEIPLAEATAALALLLVMVVLLFGMSFNDGAPLTLHNTIASGPYEGVTTTDALAARVSAVEALTSKWVGPTTGVLFFEYPGGYVLQRGIMVTNAVWMNVGPVDRITIGYFNARRWPDVVFVPSGVLTPAGASTKSSAADPLLAALADRYHVVERSVATGFTVMVPNAGLGQ